ncbi:MAG: hypothetical protein JSS34_07235 [Proteobacteria bacterium]|nr:hypothetical protein [Pseudomonadota bacterium]
MYKENNLDILYEEQLKIINEIKFTRREIDIVSCVMSGKSVKKIASFLSISTRTVEAHTYNILTKLNFTSREDIIYFIEKSGKFIFVQQYYLNLLAQEAFKEGLKKISNFLKQENKHCFIIYEKNSQEENLFITNLETDLKHLGFRPYSECVKDQKSIEHLLTKTSFSKIDYVIYIGTPKLVHYLASEDKTDAALKSQLVLGILKSCEATNKILISLTDLEESLPYNFFLIKILSKILPKLEVETIFMPFYQRNKDVKNSFCEYKSSEKKGNSCIQQNVKNNDSKCFKKLCLKLNKVLLILGTCFLVSCFVGLYFFKKINDIPSIMSDLRIPVDSVFLDRPQLINQIGLKLKRKKEDENIPIVGVLGIGGVGKTTLVRHFSRTYKSPIVWEINAETKNSVISSFKELGEYLALMENKKNEFNFIKEIEDPNEREKQIVNFVRSYLKKYKNWLLIFDNISVFAEIKNFLPENKKNWGEGGLIITTRDSNINQSSYIGSKNIIEVGELSKEEALKLFRIILCGSEKLSPEDEAKAQSFLDHLPPFPLDISIAAYYLKNSNIGYEDYLKRIEASGKDFEKLQEHLLSEMNNYAKTRYGIITLALEKVIKENPHFKALLLFICLVDSQDIPKELLEFFKEPWLVENFIYTLKKHSLITNELIELNGKKISSLFIHRSTQKISLSFLVDLLDIHEKQELIRGIISSMMSFQDFYFNKNCYYVMKLINHLEAFERNLTNMKLSLDFKEKRKKDIFFMLGYIYKHCFENYILSYVYFTKAMNIKNPSEFITNLKMATFIKDLGFSALILGETKESINLFQKSIELCRDIQNPEILIAQNLKNIGFAYRKENNFTQAKEFFFKALDKISSLELAVKQDVASEIYAQLAVLYSVTFINKEEALQGEKYLLKSLDLLGARQLLYLNPNLKPTKISCRIATNRRRLGSIYTRLGDYKKAMELGFMEAQYIIDKSLDDCTSILLQSLNLEGLGEVYLRQNSLKRAEDSLSSSIEKKEKLIGESRHLLGRAFSGESSTSARTLRAEVRIRLKDFSKAYEDCLYVFNTDKKLRDNFLELMCITCLYHAAVIKYHQGDLQKAQEYFLAFFKEMNVFCKVFLEEEKYDKEIFKIIERDGELSQKNIKIYFEKATQIYSIIYGEEHPFVKDYIKKNK